MLKLLQKRHAIKSVDIIVCDLPEGKTGKKFSKLSNWVTKKKYALGR